MKTVGKLAWHVHHDRLFEILTEPIENRITYIKSNKNLREIPTRLRLLKLVSRGRLPISVRQAYVIWERDVARWKTARWKKASTAWTRKSELGERLLNLPAIEKLHTKECPNCPWNGKTIFPKN